MHQQHRFVRLSEPFFPGAWSAAWLYPRSRSRSRYSGTEPTASAARLSPSAFTNSASRSANHPPTARSARISTAPHHCVLIHCKAARPVEGISSVPASRAEAAAPPLSAPIRAARKPRMRYWAPVQTTRGTPRKWVPGSRSSAAARRFGNPRGKHADDRVADLRQPAPPWPRPAAHTAGPRSRRWMSFRPPPQPELYSSSHFN